MAVDEPEPASEDDKKKAAKPDPLQASKLPQEVELYLHMLVLAYLLDAKRLNEVRGSCALVIDF
jgi:hypothetical protein